MSVFFIIIITIFRSLAWTRHSHHSTCIMMDLLVRESVFCFISTTLLSSQMCPFFRSHFDLNRIHRILFIYIFLPFFYLFMQELWPRIDEPFCVFLCVCCCRCRCLNFFFLPLPPLFSAGGRGGFVGCGNLLLCLFFFLQTQQSLTPHTLKKSQNSRDVLSLVKIYFF